MTEPLQRLKPLPRKLNLGVFKFASCDGCQLSLLDAEDELLAVADMVDIAYFLEATSKIGQGPYDVALVEGSITTPHDIHRIHDIRSSSRFLVTIGACATAGGIQALRDGSDCDEFVRAVYAHPEYIDTLATSAPIAAHVPVDFELRGCPINHHQLVEVLAALVRGQRPRLPNHSVCLDCKRVATVCVAVARGVPCLGPVTQAGCGAICPSFDRGCYGCFGPAAEANPQSLSETYLSQGVGTATLVPLLQNFNTAAPPFAQEANRLRRRDAP